MCVSHVFPPNLEVIKINWREKAFLIIVCIHGQLRVVYFPELQQKHQGVGREFRWYWWLNLQPSACYSSTLRSSPISRLFVDFFQSLSCPRRPWHEWSSCLSLPSSWFYRSAPPNLTSNFNKFSVRGKAKFQWF